KDDCNYHNSLLIRYSFIVQGASWEKFSLGAKFINLAVGSTRQFYKMQLKYRVAIEESIARHMETVRKAVAGVPLSMAVDVRYDTPGFSANRSSGVFMDTNTRAILQLEVGDSREVGRHSPKMERLLIERGLLYLVHQSPLIVWEIISDASRNIISLLKTEPFKHIHHSLEMWHKAKKLAVTLADITKKSACRQLLPWIRPIINHFWWSCSTCKGSVDTLLKRWMAILHHINNRHIWPGGRCRHPEGVTEIENKKWLERDSEAFKQLRKVVTNREWCGTMQFYTHCKQTWAIEKIFSHTFLHYCPKANSYSYDSYRIRNILAVMDHNNHLGRMPQVGDDGDSYAQAQVSRRTKQWVAYERKTPKDFKYIPDLMAACLHKTYGVPEKAFSKSRKSLELDKVAKNLSGDKNPGSRLLLAENKSRKTTGENFKDLIINFSTIKTLF
ncbi:uncharacterized protein LOC128169991, partial [Crassostrea angulata]|uniref:uncharacterized protein LOC128169991 n=1 Tax=Magallana angulata TaxID=2784310 RepID=UPI0022B17A65